MTSTDVAIKADASWGLPVTGMAPGLAIMFNEALYSRCKEIARIMSSAAGFTPRHLIGAPEACFAVVTRAITWKLDPLAVAQSTYQTPNGAVGYEGKLVQAIMMNSGKIDGPITFNHIGDWSKLSGKWKKGKSAKGFDIPVQAWDDKDEEGLGVVVRATVKGEREPREHTVWMRECFPRNSTLWVLRPSQQICYTAVRAFANVAAPELLMGVPFDGESDTGTMIDVTPVDARRPTRAEPKTETPAPIPEPPEPEQEANPVPEEEAGPSAADAYQLGEEAFDAKQSMFAFPKEWEQMKRSDLVEAFKEGFRAREAEVKSAKEAK